MGNIKLVEGQVETMASNDLASTRIYVLAASERAVVAKEDGHLTEKDIVDNPKKVADELFTELQIWLDNKCFETPGIAKAENIMTSRYVYKSS